MSKGVAAFRKKKKEAAERSGTGYEVYNLILGDGESAIVRFNGLFGPTLPEKQIDAMDKGERKAALTVFNVARRRKTKDSKDRESSKVTLKRRMKQEEPFCFTSHKNYPKRYNHTCTEDGLWGDKAPGCVSCFQRAQGDRTMGYPSDVFGFSVINHTKMHKVEPKGGNGKNKYFACTMDEKDRCKKCEKADANEEGRFKAARYTGLRRWIVGQQWASAIVTLNDTAGNKCAGCAGGKIKHVSWTCGNPDCGKTLKGVEADEGVKVRCKKCNEKTIPLEVVECKACDEPRRATLTDVLVRVTRSGTQKSTSYNLQIEDIVPIMDWEKYTLAIDWTKQPEVSPDSTAVQAAKLGVSDPFGKSSSAASYDDDDDDDGDGDWDDEDDDE